jgi:hypothetical protein
MEQTQMKNTDIRARELYEQLRSKVETPENIGKLVIMDVDSGDYEIDDESEAGMQASFRLQERRPNGKLYAQRIGYKTAVSFAGALER